MDIYTKNIIYNTMNIMNFNESKLSDTMKFPEYENRLVCFRDFKYFLPHNRDLDIFLEIKKLYDNSSLHSSILNGLILQINGTGFLEGLPQDKEIIEAYNLNDILNKCIFDFCLFGGTYLELFWDDKHTKINNIKHIKYPQIRIGDYSDQPFFNDQTDIFYHCSNWDKWRQFDIVPLVRFNPDNPEPHQILPIFLNDYLDVYPKPYWYQGWRWLQIDCKLAEFYLNSIENVFSPQIMIVIPGNLEPEQKEDLEFIFSSNFSGVNKKKNIIFNPSTPEMEPKIIQINQSDDGQKYHQWIDLVNQQITSMHNLPSQALVGISIPGKLGTTEELQNAQSIYNRNKVYPYRNYFLDSFTKINKYLSYPLSQIKIEDIEIEFAEKPTPQILGVATQKQSPTNGI